ncbi:MAG: hypothetical protein RMY34_29360 [Aulosira sp. DedQUE10]|nr:hypothetical protein [Aulosira sp. DedQUE10]
MTYGGAIAFCSDGRQRSPVLLDKLARRCDHLKANVIVYSHRFSYSMTYQGAIACFSR